MGMRTQAKAMVAKVTKKVNKTFKKKVKVAVPQDAAVIGDSVDIKVDVKTVIAAEVAIDKPVVEYDNTQLTVATAVRPSPLKEAGPVRRDVIELFEEDNTPSPLVSWVKHQLEAITEDEEELVEAVKEAKTPLVDISKAPLDADIQVAAPKPNDKVEGTKIPAKEIPADVQHVGTTATPTDKVEGKTIGASEAADTEAFVKDKAHTAATGVHAVDAVGIKYPAVAGDSLDQLFESLFSLCAPVAEAADLTATELTATEEDLEDSNELLEQLLAWCAPPVAEDPAAAALDLDKIFSSLLIECGEVDAVAALLGPLPVPPTAADTAALVLKDVPSVRRECPSRAAAKDVILVAAAPDLALSRAPATTTPAPTRSLEFPRWDATATTGVNVAVAVEEALAVSRARHHEELERLEARHRAQIADIVASQRRAVDALQAKIQELEAAYANLEEEMEMEKEGSDLVKARADEAETMALSAIASKTEAEAAWRAEKQANESLAAELSASFAARAQERKKAQARVQRYKSDSTARCDQLIALNDEVLDLKGALAAERIDKGALLALLATKGTETASTRQPPTPRPTPSPEGSATMFPTAVSTTTDGTGADGETSVLEGGKRAEERRERRTSGLEPLRLPAIVQGRPTRERRASSIV
ncbi:uncharacterized protein LOC62_02G002069 [Vanrija pseudolonga]|uniref:Uncharacterized protein n=1 Tax=Vanrija pseudolonga TaxID=143232 RepID=A0AAF1BGD2_9TREE|nr:hypothetical protein LOC62_02G002069 [Vanrija pseudolonga]